jgi:ABC-type nitrate/sulfonate/bicarbonate transport system substrate-binding protein
MRTLVRALTSVTVVCAVLASTGIGVSAMRPKAHSHAMTNVHIILSWLPNVQFAGLWVAQQKGWWKQAGINMTFTPWSPSVHPETDVPAKGGNTFGFQSGAAVAIAAAQGVPIRAVFAGVERSVFGLTVLAKSPIHTLADLRAKRVGYQSHEIYVPSTMLACAGLKDTDWKPVQVGPDTATLTSGTVDAQSTFLVNEPIALRLRGVKTRSFPAADHCFHFYDIVMFTSNSLIQHNPGLVKRVVGVVARGFAWSRVHPTQAAVLTVAKYFPAAKGESAGFNLKQQTLESKAFVPFARDPHGRFSGLMTASYWRDSIATQLKYKINTHRPGVNSLFTNRFNPNSR